MILAGLFSAFGSWCVTFVYCFFFFFCFNKKNIPIFLFRTIINLFYGSTFYCLKDCFENFVETEFFKILKIKNFVKKTFFFMF